MFVLLLYHFSVVYVCVAEAVLRWCRGGARAPPDSFVAPQIQKLWPFWRDFRGPKMPQNPDFLRGKKKYPLKLFAIF